MGETFTVHYNAETNIIEVVRSAYFPIASSVYGHLGYTVTYSPQKLYGKRGWTFLGLL